MQALGAELEALDAIWAAHRESVRRVLLALARDMDLADDLLQDTYLRAREGIGRYRGGDPRAWLAAIARNVYHSQARRRTAAELTIGELEAKEERPATDRLALLAIRQALADLPAAFRTALVMKHYAGYTYQEIARRQHCPVGTAKWRVSEALDRLRLVLLIERRAAMAGRAEAHGIAIVDYIYGLLPAGEAAKAQAHLAKCECCRKEAEELKQVVSALDALEGERRQMHFVELHRDGSLTLYSAWSQLNDQGEPLTTTQFQSDKDSSTGHVYQDGEETQYTVEPYLPYDNLSYTVTLHHPVPPGARLSLLATGVYSPPHRRALRRQDHGRFQLHWVQGPSSTHEVAYVQAVRLPAGAALLSVEPKPDETRDGGVATLLWRRVLPAGEFFRCAIEYRLEEAG